MRSRTVCVLSLQWRIDFDIESLDEEDFSPQLECLGFCWGRDRAGNPVTYNFYKDMDIKLLFSQPGTLQAVAALLGGWGA